MKDVYNHNGRYNNLLKEIKNFNPNRKVTFIKYNQYCVTRNLSIARKITLLNCLKVCLGDNEIQKPTRLSIYNIIQKIDNSNKSPNTKRDYKLAYRSYLSSLGINKSLIELVAVGNPKIRKPKQIITKPLYLKMKTDKTRLFVGLQQETGCRPSEELTLKYANIEYTDFGVNITVSGKTGTRTLPITDIEIVKLLLEDHKKIKDNNEYLFNFSYSYISRVVKKMLKENDYPDTYLYAFRKSKATILFSKLPEQIVKKYMGWSKSSKMADTYSFINQNMMTDAIIEMNKARGITDKKQKNLYNWGS